MQVDVCRSGYLDLAELGYCRRQLHRNPVFGIGDGQVCASLDFSEVVLGRFDIQGDRIFFRLDLAVKLQFVAAEICVQVNACRRRDIVAFNVSCADGKSLLPAAFYRNIACLPALAV